MGHGLDSLAVGFQARSCVRTVGPLVFQRGFAIAHDIDAEVRRLEGLGATRYEHEQERGCDFWVMRDPGATSSASCIRTSPLSHYDRGRGPSLSKTATERVDVIAAYTKKCSRRHRGPAPDAAGLVEVSC